VIALSDLPTKAIRRATLTFTAGTIVIAYCTLCRQLVTWASRLGCSGKWGACSVYIDDDICLIVVRQGPGPGQIAAERCNLSIPEGTVLYRLSLLTGFLFSPDSRIPTRSRAFLLGLVRRETAGGALPYHTVDVCPKTSGEPGQINCRPINFFLSRLRFSLKYTGRRN
jgi:hypothetical protein